MRPTSPVVIRMRIARAIAACLLTVAHNATGQTLATVRRNTPEPNVLRITATLAGTVVDSALRPLSNAEITIPALNLSVRSNAQGEFRLPDIPAGEHEVHVRRLGFQAITTSITLGENRTKTVRFILTPITVLDSVSVNAERPGANFSDFETRRKIGIGKFLTREELAKFDGGGLDRVVVQFAGVRVVRGTGNRSWIASTRSPAGGGQAGRSLSKIDQKTGAQKRCYAKVYVNDGLVYSGADGEDLFDVSRVEVGEIETLEYYAGPAQTPARYAGLGATCGVLVLWMR